VIKTVYLGLGSNVGDREAELRRAIGMIESPDLHVKRISSVFETAPLYKEDQRKFLNAVIEAATTLFPVQLLHRLQAVERKMGRLRTVRNAPRNIDIDILIFGRFVVESENLLIPHPGIAERRFVLEPLAELVPDLRHPVIKKTIRELLASVPSGGVRKTDIRLD
jgi:2-amino-4-hydroxy-6-hydroxymethyldihydropteridine diphosphokinase